MSNSPVGQTGYGVVTREVCFRLRQQYGYDIYIAAYWGLDSGSPAIQAKMDFGSKRLIIREYTNPPLPEYTPIYPKLFDAQGFGQDMIRLVLKKIKPKVFITLFDTWVGLGWLNQLHNCFIPQVVVDHDPLPIPIKESIKGCFKPIAISKFGLEKLKEAEVPNPGYIPHGVDTEEFKPLDDKNKQREAIFKRKEFNDKFIVGINAANKGDRKAFDRMLGAFKLFLERNPEAKKDAWIYLNTWTRFPEGWDLTALIKYLGIGENAIIVNQFRKFRGIMTAQQGNEEPGMNEWYNSIDVLFNISKGEGFGIPIIEAQSCGVPTIVTDFSAMPELVKGHGWVVPIRDVVMTPLLSYQA